MPGIEPIAVGTHTNLGVELEIFIHGRQVPMFASCQKRTCGNAVVPFGTDNSSHSLFRGARRSRNPCACN